MARLRQRKLGFVLTATAVVAVIAYCLVFITHSKAIGAPHFVGSGDSVIVMDQEIETNISLLYLIPIASCGLAGLLLLLWPARKPPKLPG